MNLEPHPNPRGAGISAIIFLVILALCAYGFFAILGKESNLNSSATPVVKATVLPSGQTAYTSAQYGFGFDYESTWYLDPAATKQLVLQEPAGAVSVPKIYVNYYETVAEANTELLYGASPRSLDDFMLGLTVGETNPNIQKLTLAGSDARSATLEVNESRTAPQYVITTYHGGHVYFLMFDDATTTSDLSPAEKLVISTFHF